MALIEQPPSPASAEESVNRVSIPLNRHCLACLTQNSQGLEASLRWLSAVIAEPAPGYRFVQWNDGDTEPERYFDVTHDVELTATFEPDEP